MTSVWRGSVLSYGQRSTIDAQSLKNSEGNLLPEVQEMGEEEEMLRTKSHNVFIDKQNNVAKISIRASVSNQ